MPENALFSFRSSQLDTGVEHLSDSRWARGECITLDRDWLGRSWIRKKGLLWSNLCEVRSVWEPDAVYFHVQSWYEKPPDGKDRLILFLRPPSREDYFELAIEANGKYLDSHIRRARVDVDFSWSSQAEVVTRTFPAEGIWRSLVRLPFGPASVPRPGAGVAWRFNVVRTIGSGEDYEFLSWRPTFTRLPDPHVPTSFGILVFLESDH